MPTERQDKTWIGQIHVAICNMEAAEVLGLETQENSELEEISDS